MTAPPPPSGSTPPPPADTSQGLLAKANNLSQKLAGAASDDSWAIAEDGRNGSVTFSPHGLDRVLKKSFGKDDRQTIHYRGIVGVEHDRKRMGRDIVKVNTSGGTFEWKVVADAEGFVDRLNGVIASGGVPTPTPTPQSQAAPAGMAAKIAEVAVLHQQGVLSAEEFAAAKQRIIAEG